jgi:protein-S-isoprenylcysteine O-methyltransferase Ste14
MIGPNLLLTLVVGAAIGWSLWKFPPPAWNAIAGVGLGLLVLGFVCWTVARFQLGRSLTLTAQAKQLVTRGLYAKIRNPIYIFASCTIAGLILIRGRPMWLLSFVLIIPLQVWRSRKEAAVLEASFQEQYRKYRAGTWF